MARLDLGLGFPTDTRLRSRTALANQRHYDYAMQACMHHIHIAYIRVYRNSILAHMPLGARRLAT